MRDKHEPVRLRGRKMPSGNTSLYLDIYADGRRKYEYLKLYLTPEATKADREKNRQTMRLAEAVRTKRAAEVLDGRYGLNIDSGAMLDTPFLDYFRHLCEKRKRREGSLGNWGNWWSALKHLERYCRPGMTFRDVTPRWLQGFKDYLDTTTRIRDERKKSPTVYDRRPLSQNSKLSYFNKVRACVRQACEDGILPRNPVRSVENYKVEEKERVYLTMDEVRAMAATECRYPELKRAFLFSCLTGLRKSDIEKMTWSEVRRQGDFVRIVFRQKKTGGQEYMDISPEAVPYLGERKGDEEKVFPDFHYSAYLLVELKAWATRSGVAKDVTFHSGRHTFAVLMLDLGADIYTVQKLLGHKEIATTEVYAHIMDKKKQAAVSMIPRLKLTDEGDGKP